jgi:hypothetical protein
MGCPRELEVLSQKLGLDKTTHPSCAANQLGAILENVREQLTLLRLGQQRHATGSTAELDRLFVEVARGAQSTRGESFPTGASAMV